MAEVQVGVFQGMQQRPTAGDRPILVLSLFIEIRKAQAGQGAGAMSMNISDWHGLYHT